MASTISPQKFFQSAELLENPHLATNDIFDWLGKNLTQRILAILESEGVTDKPKILGEVHPQAIIEGAVYIAKGAKVGPAAYICGPSYIGPECEVRHGAFIRGSVYAARKAIIGHTTEVKGSLFGEEAKAGHFAYVGDSLLGDHTNLGAGTKLANLKLRGNEVKVLHPETDALTPSGLRKLGGILGHHVQTGCNAVISPGSILLPHTAVLPCVHFHGTLKKGYAK